MINGLKLFHPLLLQLSEVLPMAATSGGTSFKRTSKSDADLQLLDKLVTTLLERKAAESPTSASPSGSRSSTLQRLRPLSRSLSRSLRLGSFKRNNNSALPTIAESSGSGRRSDHMSAPGVRNVFDAIKNAPQRFSTAANDDESRNILDWRRFWVGKEEKQFFLINLLRRKFFQYPKKKS